MPKKTSSSLELGPVTAERAFTLFRQDGTPLSVSVRLGKPFTGGPFKAPESPEYRCPAQIVGIGDERVVAPWAKIHLSHCNTRLISSGRCWIILCSAKILRYDFGRTEPAGFGAILRIKAVV